MKPSYAVTKKARKSSRFYNEHRHVHTPGRLNMSSKYLNSNHTGFMDTIVGGLSMLGMLRKRTSKHAGGHISKDNKRGKQP